MGRICSRRIFLAISGAVMLVACNEGPAYLDQSEENLGLREAWYGTDHRVFHAALLYPYGLGLRSSGYLVAIEKGDQDKVRGIRYRPDLLADDSPSDTERFKAIRERLKTDRKAHLITNVIRSEARIDEAGPARIGQCVLYTVLDRPPDAPFHEDPAGRLFDRCGGEPGEPAPAPAHGEAFAASWQAIASLRDALTRDLENPHYSYTDILVVVMGWNTAQPEALQNFNSFVGHLLDEAAERQNGFRPLIIGVTWPWLWALSDWSVVPTALVRLLSFENKADDAEEVGATWLRDVISYAILPAREAARAAMQGRTGAKAARVVLVGHSFGARALVAALTQRPQLKAPSGADPRPIERGDPVLLLEGAFEIERLFDRDARVSPPPAIRAPQEPFSAGDPVLTLTASDYDTAVRAALWGWYAGDARTYDEVCAHARDNEPWRGLELSSFGCGLARNLGGAVPYGLDLCQQSMRQGTPVDLAGKRVGYFDASHMINCNAPFTGGGAHSDIYRRETARFLLDRIVASP
jgi:hypothetical protein